MDHSELKLVGDNKYDTYRQSQGQKRVASQSRGLKYRAVQVLDQETEEWRDASGEDVPHHVVETDIEQGNDPPP